MQNSPKKFELQMAMRHVLVYVCLMQYMEECISIMNGRSLGNEEMSVVDTVEYRRSYFLKINSRGNKCRVCVCMCVSISVIMNV